MNRELKERWIDEYTKLYEQGKAIRGGYVGLDETYCAVGTLYYKVRWLRGERESVPDFRKILVANDHGLADNSSLAGTPVTPSGFAEVIRLIKEIPET